MCCNIQLVPFVDLLDLLRDGIALVVSGVVPGKRIQLDNLINNAPIFYFFEKNYTRFFVKLWFSIYIFTGGSYARYHKGALQASTIIGNGCLPFFLRSSLSGASTTVLVMVLALEIFSPLTIFMISSFVRVSYSIKP